MGLKDTDVLPRLREYVVQQRKRGLDNYWWSSITERDLMTEEERKERSAS